MKRFSFNLITLILAFFAVLQNASAQWVGLPLTTPLTPTIIHNLNPAGSKVGIGTKTPSQKLQIVGGNILLDDTDVSATTGNIFFGGLTYPVTNQEGMRLSYHKGNHSSYMDVRTNALTNGIIFRADLMGGAPGTERMRICANGAVIIGGAVAGANKLAVNGTICSSGPMNICSDSLFKKGVQTLGGSLAILSHLRGVQYEYRQSEFADRNFPSGKTNGFIAQELREVLPELVNEGPDGYLMVNYEGIIPVLTEAVKELKAEKDDEIAALKQELSEKSQQIYAFEARIAKMEAMLASVSVPSQQTNGAAFAKTLTAQSEK